MKGIMVEQIGTGRQMNTGGMEEAFAKMKGPKGIAPKMPKKLGNNTGHFINLCNLWNVFQLFQALPVILPIMTLIILKAQEKRLTTTLNCRSFIIIHYLSGC